MCACNMYFYIQNHFLLKHLINKKWFRAIFLFWEPTKLLQPTSWNQQFQQDGHLLIKYNFKNLFIKSQCEGSKMQWMEITRKSRNSIHLSLHMKMCVGVCVPCLSNCPVKGDPGRIWRIFWIFLFRNKFRIGIHRAQSPAWLLWGKFFQNYRAAAAAASTAVGSVSMQKNPNTDNSLYAS